MENNAIEYKPVRGAFAAVAAEKGVTRQAIRAAWESGKNMEIIEAVVRFSLEENRKQREALLQLAQTITQNA